MLLAQVGHMNPNFMKILDDTQAFLRYTFGTQNNMTVAISGTGHAGMEAGVANIVERGDKVIVGTNGIWGERMADLMGRFGASVVRCRSHQIRKRRMGPPCHTQLCRSSAPAP